MFKQLTVVVVLFLTAITAAAHAEGLRGEQQLDLAISPSGTYDSDATTIDAEGYHLYAAWSEASVPPATTKEVYFSRSDDGGKSWSSPQRLSDNASVDDGSPDISSDGSLVVVVWLHGSSTATQDIQGVVSTDGGVTFGSVKDLSGIFKGDAGDADSLSVHVNGTYVYLAFEDDHYNPGGTEDLFVISSSDSGNTFSAPIRVNDSTAGTVDVDDPELKTVGATAYIVWVDKRTGNDRVYFDRTTDGGAHWGADKRLDRSGTLADSDSPAMSVEGTNVHVVWIDDRNDLGVADQVFYVSSTDSGVTFTLDKKLGSAPLGADADPPRVSVEGSHVYACWADDRHGLDDIFLAVSTDGGATFGAEKALDPDAGTIKDESPHLRSFGDSVFVVYREEINLLDQVWLEYSPDDGTTFQRLQLSTTLPSTADADNDEFAVTTARDIVGIWVDNRAGGTNNDVYVNGQRFPNLTAIPNGKKVGFHLSDATPSEEGQLFVAAFSVTGIDSFELIPTMNLCLTVDWFTNVMIEPWAVPLVTATVTNGAADTFDLPFKKFDGWAVGIVLDSTTLDFLATTDPVTF